jgi:hypothetical protein
VEKTLLLYFIEEFLYSYEALKTAWCCIQIMHEDRLGVDAPSEAEKIVVEMIQRVQEFKNRPGRASVPVSRGGAGGAGVGREKNSLPSVSKSNRERDSDRFSTTHIQPHSQERAKKKKKTPQ